MAEFNISPPWEILYNELNALFGEDPEIDVIKSYSDEVKKIELLVADSQKAESLEKILPPYKEYGNTIVFINVKPANVQKDNMISLYEKAFVGNPVLRRIYIKDIPGSQVNFLLFRNEVVRFFADNIRDYEGKKSMLFEEIAADIFPDRPGIYFCTEDKTEAEEYSCLEF